MRGYSDSYTDGAEIAFSFDSDESNLNISEKLLFKNGDEITFDGDCSQMIDQSAMKAGKLLFTPRD